MHNDKNNFSFVNFLTDNAKELKKFSDDVNTLSASALTALQRLPVSLRRRAASHNVKRLPFRFRKMATVSAAKRVVRKCRKYQRRHMDIKAIFANRQSKNKWLYTHLWHAKRFRIENKWGWRVPVVPNQKTFRPCTKAMSNGCAIMDISYFSSYELYGCRKLIIDKLKSYLNNDEVSEIFEDLLKGIEIYTVFYECDQYPFGAICPLKMVMVGESDVSSILISLHPAAVTEFVSTICTAFNLTDNKNNCWDNTTNNVALIDRSGDNCRFRLLGVESHRILTSLLRNSSDIAKLAEWPLKEIVHGYNVEALIDNPELCKPRLKETDALPWEVRPWRKAEELLHIARRQSFFQVDTDTRLSKIGGIMNDPMKQLEPVIEGEKCPIMLLRHRYGVDSHGGWDVVVPAKWAMKTWMTLIMKGCRPMGMRYWLRFCSLETKSVMAKLDCYPMMLWPDTVEGKREADECAIREKQAWGRRPKAKRVNYELQGTTHPFDRPYQSLVPDTTQRLFVVRDRKKLIRVIDKIMRGMMECEMGDLDGWEGGIMHQGLAPAMVTSLRGCVRRCGVVMASVAGDTEGMVLEQGSLSEGGGMIRPVLGYMESGDQSMVIGKGRGTALISLHNLVQYYRHNNTLFWVKNPNERRLQPVTLSAAK